VRFCPIYTPVAAISNCRSKDLSIRGGVEIGGFGSGKGLATAAAAAAVRPVREANLLCETIGVFHLHGKNDRFGIPCHLRQRELGNDEIVVLNFHRQLVAD
jgi:hypothetical protein